MTNQEMRQTKNIIWLIPIILIAAAFILPGIAWLGKKIIVFLHYPNPTIVMMIIIVTVTIIIATIVYFDERKTVRRYNRDRDEWIINTRTDYPNIFPNPKDVQKYLDEKYGKV